ncbi:hypothetical protein C1Y63_06250 [Corynebacterium sp. 13CS0277]|uniref:hypothetical protein n=1 Tax=Corynebacterium sp. 13CS0277 TaxID=2071994 RepID=UPI000D02D29C|nr:hypothetical protein [Corynebacterium sp. 13CS0277]PRQ11447.1 hypothetical protein C1Y63_06250 [Corynebacterium sp. 13CS0277]
MATNWFDWAKAQEQQADGIIDELIESGDSPESSDPGDLGEATPTRRRRLKRKSRAEKPAPKPAADPGPGVEEFTDDNEAAPRISPKLTTLIGVAAVGALVALSVTAMSRIPHSDASGNTSGPVASALPSTTVAKPGPQPGVEAIDDDTKVAVAGSHCVPGSGETKITEDDSTLRGALAAFERVYFNRDAQAVREALDPTTPLAQRDWQAVLDKSVPEGTQWCLRMQPVDGDHVEAAVTVTEPSGLASTYEQTVTATEVDGHFKLKDFS